MHGKTVLLILPLALALVACGQETPGTSGQQGEASSESSTITIKIPDGDTVTQQTGKDVKVDLPKGFTIFPDAKVIANTVTTAGNERQITIMMESAAMPAEIAEHYKNEAEDAGMEITIDLGFEGNNSIAADRASDGLKLTASASRGEGAEGTTVMLNFIEGQGG